MTSSKKPASTRRKRAQYQEAESPAITENPTETIETAEPEATQALSQESATDSAQTVAAPEPGAGQTIIQKEEAKSESPAETRETAQPETLQAQILEEGTQAEASKALVPAIAKLERDQVEDEEVVERVEHLNKGVGWILISAGIVGMVVPGVLGTPFLIMGGLALWPGNRKRVERWRQGHSPKVFHGAMKQINRFLDDLEKRYPRIDKQ